MSAASAPAAAVSAAAVPVGRKLYAVRRGSDVLLIEDIDALAELAQELRSIV
jgi:hypothetical protein